MRRTTRHLNHRMQPKNHATHTEVTNMNTRIKSHGRTSRRYKQQRQQFREHCEKTKANCWLCGMPIDYRIKHPDNEAFELDHLYPVSTHPQHAEDPANFRPSHSACNAKRGNKTPTGTLGTPSRQWLKA